MSEFSIYKKLLKKICFIHKSFLKCSQKGLHVFVEFLQLLTFLNFDFLELQPYFLSLFSVVKLSLGLKRRNSGSFR